MDKTNIYQDTKNGNHTFRKILKELDKYQIMEELFHNISNFSKHIQEIKMFKGKQNNTGPNVPKKERKILAVNTNEEHKEQLSYQLVFA